MRRRSMLAMLMAGLAVPARGQDSGVSPSDRAAIRAVIEGQLAAFQRDDGTAAFAAASPMIQGMFVDPERFMAMVRGLYPPVYRPRIVQFGALGPIDGRLVQKVELVGPDGAPALALYTMVRGPDGAWRIDGCALTESENVAT